MNSCWTFLSYIVSDALSAYRNGRRIEKEMVSSTEKGDVSNHTAAWVSMHFGTHVDFPRHFLKDGRTSDDYEAEYFLMEKVCVVYLERLVNPYLLSIEDMVDELKDAPKDLQAILVKTGFGQHRMEDCYWNDNIGVNQGVAQWLRDRFPYLRVLGFDFLSVSGSHYRELGRQVHRELFEVDILPIEDMYLEPLNSGDYIENLIISPYRVSGSDAAPVTAIAKIKQK